MNTKDNKTETELLILEAAKKIFIRKGMGGARMQEIADEAGINKSLLHYYYRSKEKLYEAVFTEAVQKMIPIILNLFESDISLEEKFHSYYTKHIEFLQDNPFLPQFIIHELTVNPERFVTVFGSHVGQVRQTITKQIEREIEKGKISKIDAKHLIINVISMAIFPFLVSPLIKIIMGFSDEDFQQFLDERKTLLPEFVLRSILKKTKEDK